MVGLCVENPDTEVGAHDACVLTKGWVWEVARINFPQAICILDFYHAGELLSMLAEALYSADAARVQSQAKIWRGMLLEDRLQDVLAQARKDLPDIPAPRSAAEKQIAYFKQIAHG